MDDLEATTALDLRDLHQRIAIGNDINTSSDDNLLPVPALVLRGCLLHQPTGAQQPSPRFQRHVPDGHVILEPIMRLHHISTRFLKTTKLRYPHRYPIKFAFRDTFQDQEPIVF